MENSNIEWCDHTFNPWIGCQKVSPGCDHCYAEALMDTRYGRVQWGPHGGRVRTSQDNWKMPPRDRFLVISVAVTGCAGSWSSVAS
jgi:protein gp37